MFLPIIEGIIVACRCASFIIAVSCMIFCYDYLHAIKALSRVDDAILFCAMAFSGWMLFEHVVPSVLELTGPVRIGFFIGVIPCAYLCFRIDLIMHDTSKKMHGK